MLNLHPLLKEQNDIEELEVSKIYRFFDRYRGEYKKTMTLAFPIILTQVGQITVQLADNAMVGYLGALPLAAVSFGGTVFFLTFILAMGITMGMTPLVGERYSRGEHKDSAILLQNGMSLYLILAIIFFALQMAIIPLMYRMGQPVEVVDMAIPYFRWSALSVVPFLFFGAFKQFLEGIGKTKANMVIIISANIINVIFNYILIFGKFGFPQMGAEGAGLSTFIARMCMPLFVIIYFYTHHSLRRYFKYFSWENFKLSHKKLLLSVGFPIGAQMLMEGSAFAFTSIMMGWMGTVAIAANQIASVVSNFAFMIIVGLSAATTIRISHSYGMKDPAQLRNAATASYHIQLLWNTITAIVFISLRHQIPLIFNNDPEVISVAATLLIFIAAFQFSDGVQAITVGILRGMQDVRSIMVVAFFCYLVLNLPIAYLCAFTFGVGPGGLWIGIIFGLSMAAVLLRRRFRRQFALFEKRVSAEPIK